MRFAVFGVPVHVHPTFLFVGLLLSGAATSDGFDAVRAATWIALVFVSILVHELGHAFAMRHFGREPSIELVALGGETRWGDGPRVPPGRVALVALAGPCAGFVFAIPFLVAHVTGVAANRPDLASFIRDALFVNIGWGLLNLLPILPLDGGCVLDVVAFSAFGAAGSRYARYLSIGLAGAILALAIVSGQMFIGMLAFFAIATNWAQIRARTFDPSVPERTTPRIDEATDEVIEAAWQSMVSGRVEDAIALLELRLEELASSAETELARRELLETLAWAHLDRGDEDAAIRARESMPSSLAASALLDARLLLARGRVAEGFEALEKAYRETPGDRAAVVLAAAWLDAGNPERSVEVLRTLRGAQVTSWGHHVIASALFHDAHYEHALDVSSLAFNRFRTPDFAYDAACALARLGRVDDALERLSKAADTGWADPHAAANDPDLASIRDDVRFGAILERIHTNAKRAEKRSGAR